MCIQDTLFVSSGRKLGGRGNAQEGCQALISGLHLPGLRASAVLWWKVRASPELKAARAESEHIRIRCGGAADLAAPLRSPEGAGAMGKSPG